MVQADEPALFTGKHEEAKHHVGLTAIVTVEFEARQREVHVRPSLIDQIACLVPAGRTCARYAFGFKKADGI
jgi:hypothetical protein